jgi:hypothetical protein
MKITSILAPALAVLSLSAVCAPQVLAAPKKPAKAKPAASKAKAPKPKARKLIKEVMGTEQLSGWEGSMGEMFTLGTNPAVNFALKKAEYSIARSNIAGNSHWPKGDEKLLVLHFTVQNPNKHVIQFGPQYLSIKAVDSGGVTRNWVSDAARESTGERLSMPLNPGQKVDGYTVIPVAAWGEVPKLIVASGYEPKANIVRYDLRGKVAKLAAPFGDAKDAATALKLVPAKAGVFFPVTDHYDARLDSVAYTSEPIKGRAPDTGKRFFVATFTFQNKSPIARPYAYNYFRADLKDVDGEKTDYSNSMLKGSRDEEVNTNLAAGEEGRGRFYWQVPANVEAKTILLQYGYDKESRTFAFDVEGAKK